MRELFRRTAARVSQAAGSAWVFLLAFTLVIVWALTGPMFGYSNTWQLIINTGTTIGTFLMVFLIQNTQNRDAKAMQLKLDELIRATRASDSFIDIEDLSDDEMAYISDEFRKMHDKTNNPALKKFHKKLESVHQKRSLEGAEKVASHVVDMLNPFTGHSSENPKK